MHGYAGKILYVDLSTGKTKTEPLTEEVAKKFIGPTGFGIKMLLENLEPDVEPFDPENPLVFTVGPLAGTMAPTTGKHGVFARSPESNLLGEGYSTGFFGPELKRAGYDIVVLKGKCEKPCYLWIDDDSVQIMDASHLWGKTTWETETAIRDEIGDYYVRIACIGPAGEKMVRVGCIINDHWRAVGRTGLGAVMGSKNLKAVVVRGTNDVTVADPEGVREHSLELYEDMRHGPNTVKYRTLGTPANILKMNKNACLPTKNYQQATFEGAEKVSGEYLNEHFIVKIQGCEACPMRCEHVAEIPEGRWKGTNARMEYEIMMGLGPYCGVDSMEALIKAKELCDKYGMGAISTGIIIGFGMECYERGLIDKKDTGGLELEFGNAEAMVEMVQKIAKREDIGDVLAEGVKRAAEKIGQGSEDFACHIKGVEVTGYDIRGLKTCALGYAVSRRGADHQRHGSYGHDLSGEVDRYKVEEGRGKLVMEDEDVYCIFDSLILCKFNRRLWDYDRMARMYREVTGIPMTGEEIHKAGERISNLARIFNIKMGFTREDDHLPSRVMNTPIPSGVSKGSYVSQEELDFLLDDYYSARGWTKQGIPTEEKLKELGLEEYLPITKPKIETQPEPETEKEEEEE
ncbi:MAG: aldehyde ferredoxin oxidoreductase family protein [Thermoproteota archaeon]